MVGEPSGQSPRTIDRKTEWSNLVSLPYARHLPSAGFTGQRMFAQKGRSRCSLSKAVIFPPQCGTGPISGNRVNEVSRNGPSIPSPARKPGVPRFARIMPKSATADFGAGEGQGGGLQARECCKTKRPSPTLPRKSRGEGRFGPSPAFTRSPSPRFTRRLPRKPRFAICREPRAAKRRFLMEAFNGDVAERLKATVC